MNLPSKAELAQIEARILAGTGSDADKVRALAHFVSGVIAQLAGGPVKATMAEDMEVIAARLQALDGR